MDQEASKLIYQNGGYIIDSGFIFDGRFIFDYRYFFDGRYFCDSRYFFDGQHFFDDFKFHKEGQRAAGFGRRRCLFGFQELLEERWSFYLPAQP